MAGEQYSVGGVSMVYSYHMREAQDPRKETLEIAAAVVAVVVLVVCAISSVPRFSQTAQAGPGAKEQVAQERQQNEQSLAELQTALRQLQVRNTSLEADVVKIARSLESNRSELAGLKEEHSTLGTQVAATASRLQQLEATVQQTNERLAKAGDSPVLHKVAKERDDALAQAKQSNDQVRQLTLKLQKAGVYP